MSKEMVTTEAIQEAVLQRIMGRQYAVGERLPSVRDLAKELGANRNTVNKAYQTLVDLGILEITSQGRKGFQVKTQNKVNSSRAALRKYFYSQSLQLIWQGLAAGLSAQEVSSQLSEALDEVFGLGHVSIAFFECNRQDSKEMGRYLSEVLNREIYCGFLDELENDTDIVQNFDLIITTFHHLSGVMQSLEAYADKVVGIDTRLTPEVLFEIAKLPKGRMVVVSTLASTAQMLRHILYSYYPDLSVETLTLDDEAGIRALAATSEHLLVTHTCAEKVAKLSKRVADVVIHFQVDQQSIQFLNKRVDDLKIQKTQSLVNVMGNESKNSLEYLLKS